MPKDYATAYLLQNGFEVTAGQIYYKGERVGTTYMNEMYMAKTFPHLTNSTYHFIEKEEIRYVKDFEKILEQAVERLLDSPRRFEEEMRNSRVNEVKRYFSKRRALNAFMDMPVICVERKEESI